MTKANYARKSNHSIEKTNDIFGESFYSMPRSFLNKINQLSRPAIVLGNYLFSYFSSETGRKKNYKIANLKELVNLTDLSKTSIKRGIQELIDSEVFLIHETEETKNLEKHYLIYINNESSKKLFNEVEKGNVNLFIHINKIVEAKKNNIISWTPNLENSPPRNEVCPPRNEVCSPRNEVCPPRVESSSPRVESNDIAETIENTTIEPNTKNAQDYYIKEYLYKDNNNKETSLPKNDTTEKVSTENKKDVVCDVSKNLNEKVLTPQETLLLEFGVPKDKVSEFANTPIQLIEESMELTRNKPDVLVENRPRYLLGVLKKKAFNAENKTYEEIPPAPKKIDINKPTIDKILNYFYSIKVNPKDSQFLENSFKYMIDHRKEETFMNSFRKQNFTKEEIKILIDEIIDMKIPNLYNQYKNQIQDFWEYFEGKKELEESFNPKNMSNIIFQNRSMP